MGQPLGRGREEWKPTEGDREPTKRTPEGAAARRRVLIYGHATLREKSLPVEQIDGDVRALVESLLATMDAAPGIGLAAPQVGELRRLFVVDPSRIDERGRRLVLINPRILEFGGLGEYEEGCLSVPGIYAVVTRPDHVLVGYHDPDGKEHREEFEGIMARVIQHEYDHLDGKLFVDHLSRMRRALLMKKLRGLEERSEAE